MKSKFRAGVAAGKLMFTLSSGESISCECIAGEWAQKIVADIGHLVQSLELVEVASLREWQNHGISRQTMSKANWKGISTYNQGECTPMLVFDPREGVCVAELYKYGNWLPLPSSHDGEILHPTHWDFLPTPPDG